MPRGQRWSDEDTERGLQALVEHDGNSGAASEACGIPARTLREWRASREFADEFAARRREKRKSLIDKVWQAAELAIDTLMEKLPEMPGNQISIALGILIDKGLVLRGEPSQITKTEGGDGTAILLAAIEKELAQSESEGEGEADPEAA